MRSAENLSQEHLLVAPKNPETHAPLPSFLPDNNDGGLLDRLTQSTTIRTLGSVAISTMSGVKKLFTRSPRGERVHYASTEYDDHAHSHNQESHEPHSHAHHDGHDVTMSSELSERLGRIQLGAAAVNAVVMLTRGAILGIKESAQAGLDSINIMSATDAGHNVIDWLKWKLEAAVDRHDLSPRTYKIFRGLTCAALAGGGAWSIADATLLHSDYNTYQGVASGVSAGVALYTGNVLRKGLAEQFDKPEGWVGLWRRRKKISSRNRDKAIHAGTDIFMATGAAVGNLSGAAGNLINNSGVATSLGSMATALTIAGGAAAIGYFGIHTPFVKGLDKPDNCLVHDHSKSKGAHDHGEVITPAQSINAADLLAQHSAQYRKKSWLEQTRSRGRHQQERSRSWWKKSLAVGALAVSAWFAAGGETQNSEVPANTPAVVRPEAPTNTPAPLPDIYTEQQISTRPGDSQWSIASQKITEATGITTPQERHIAQIVRQMTQDNQAIAPNPNLIHPGDILEVPSVGAIQMIVSH